MYPSMAQLMIMMFLLAAPSSLAMGVKMASMVYRTFWISRQLPSSLWLATDKHRAKPQKLSISGPLIGQRTIAVSLFLRRPLPYHLPRAPLQTPPDLTLYALILWYSRNQSTERHLKYKGARRYLYCWSRTNYPPH